MFGKRRKMQKLARKRGFFRRTVHRIRKLNKITRGGFRL